MEFHHNFTDQMDTLSTSGSVSMLFLWDPPMKSGKLSGTFSETDIKCNCPTLIQPTDAAESESFGWQSDKCCMKQRFGFIFNSKRYSDITFVVGREPNVQKIPAHKVVLTVGSKVFEVMFQENWATDANEIELADTDPAAFLALLRYLYTDEIVVTTSTVVPVLNLARNFNIFPLEKGCTKFFVENLKADNAFALLNQAVLFQEQHLFKCCIEAIDDHTFDAIRTDDFCKVDYNVLKLVLRRDNLRVREIDLFEALVRWSKAECKRRNMPETLESQQTVLKGLLSLIRYPLISADDFSVKVALSRLLPEKQTVALFRYFQGIPDESVRFISTPRAEPISESWHNNSNATRMASSLKPNNKLSSLRYEEIASPRMRSSYKSAGKENSNGSLPETFVVRRFTSTQNKWVYMGGYDEIGFLLDRNVKLKGIKLYGSRNAGDSYQVSVTVTNYQSKMPLYNTQTFHTCNGSDETYKISFNNPVSLTANTEYVITASIEGTPSLYGCKGTKTAITTLESGKEIAISFFKVRSNKHDICRTDIDKGQIPELCFEL